jgi:hypothetical protein
MLIPRSRKNHYSDRKSSKQQTEKDIRMATTYAPTNDSEAEAKDQFHEQLERAFIELTLEMKELKSIFRAGADSIAAELLKNGGLQFWMHWKR